MGASGQSLKPPATSLAQAALTMYLVEASIRPKILRTGQAVLPLKPSSTRAIGLPGGGGVQMVVTGGRGHSCRAGGGGASAGQGLFPVVDQLPEAGAGRLQGESPYNSPSLPVPPEGHCPPSPRPPTSHHHHAPPTSALPTLPSRVWEGPIPRAHWEAPQHTHWRTPRCSRLYLPPSRTAALCTASMARSMAWRTSCSRPCEGGRSGLLALGAR